MDYRESVDITGTIPQMFERGIKFFKDNLQHTQQGQNFNSIGKLEISLVAIEGEQFIVKIPRPEKE